jgi:phosphatidylglycerophosphate synthase
MLDAPLRKLIDPYIARAAAPVAGTGISANQVTLAGFAVALAALASIATEHYLFGLVFIVLNRLLDALDGAVARQTAATDLGGYLDIALDFVFYGGVPFAFALADPGRALAASFLIFSFIGTGSTFLTYAVFAARRGVETELRGKKSFYHQGGLTEATETFIAFALVCIVPDWFGVVAYIFGTLCFVTAGMRIGEAVSSLRSS